MLHGFTRAESCFAEGAREMYLDKQYIAPLLHDKPYWDKPPVHYWLIIWFYQMLGVSLLSARAVSVVAALLTATTFAIFIKTILGEEIALLATMILTSTLGFYELGSTAMPDMLLCLFDTVAVFCAYLALISRSKYRPTWLCAMSVSFALGWMTKGPIAILIPAIAIIASLVIFRQPIRLSAKELSLVVIVFLALVIPWHLIVYKKYGSFAFEWLYLRGNFKRFVGLDSGYNFGHSPNYMITSLLSGFLPWTFFLIPALYKTITSAFRQKEYQLSDKFLLLMILWASCNTLFFSLSWSNWNYYSLPIYPALAILTANFLFELKNRFSLTKIEVVCSIIAAGGFLTALCYSLMYLPLKTKQDRYLYFAQQIKQIPARVPFYFHADLNGQYLLIDHIGFETGRMPLCAEQEKIVKMSFSFQPFVVLLPQRTFEDLPSSCKAKLKIIEIEPAKWINFPGCMLINDGQVGKPISLILASHRCQLNTIISKNLVTFRNQQSGVCDNHISSSSKWDRERKKTDGLASWWFAKAYFAEPTRPDIVILGGSQLVAIQGADAYCYDRTIDLTGDHRSYTIERDLKRLLQKNWRVLIGSLPGAMVSDQLLISRALFSGQYKPEAVLVTFSPRDFIDNTCTSPCNTEAFSFFSRYAKLGSYLKLFSVDHASKLLRDDHFIPLRGVLQEARLNNYNFVPRSKDYFESVSPLALGEPFERICPGEITMNSGDGYFFDDNTNEYQSRYKSPCSPQSEIQLSYFDALLTYLAQRHIKVFAVDMPLTDANRKLLPDKFWSYYHNRIYEMCQSHGATCLDLCTSDDFDTKTDFCDTAHLNLLGGTKLAKYLAKTIAGKL